MSRARRTPTRDYLTQGWTAELAAELFSRFHVPEGVWRRDLQISISGVAHVVTSDVAQINLYGWCDIASGDREIPGYVRIRGWKGEPQSSHLRLSSRGLPGRPQLPIIEVRIAPTTEQLAVMNDSLTLVAASPGGGLDVTVRLQPDDPEEASRQLVSDGYLSAVPLTRLWWEATRDLDRTLVDHPLFNWDVSAGLELS